MKQLLCVLLGIGGLALASCSVGVTDVFLNKGIYAASVTEESSNLAGCKDSVTTAGLLSLVSDGAGNVSNAASGGTATPFVINLADQYQCGSSPATNAIVAALPTGYKSLAVTYDQCAYTNVSSFSSTPVTLTYAPDTGTTNLVCNYKVTFTQTVAP